MKNVTLGLFLLSFWSAAVSLLLTTSHTRLRHAEAAVEKKKGKRRRKGLGLFLFYLLIFAGGGRVVVIQRQNKNLNLTVCEFFYFRLPAGFKKQTHRRGHINAAALSSQPGLF